MPCLFLPPRCRSPWPVSCWVVRPQRPPAVAQAPSPALLEHRLLAAAPLRVARLQPEGRADAVPCPAPLLAPRTCEAAGPDPIQTHCLFLPVLKTQPIWKFSLASSVPTDSCRTSGPTGEAFRGSGRPNAPLCPSHRGNQRVSAAQQERDFFLPLHAQTLCGVNHFHAGS